MPNGSHGRVVLSASAEVIRKIEREVRLNERIRAQEVRLIDENGAQLGVMPTQHALQIARERNYDLIEVAPNAQPPVCRIMDYGKHKYEQAKRERETRRKSKTSEVRLLRMKPQIGEHDLDIKIRKLKQLLGEGDKVRISLRFRGREMSRPELGRQLLDRIAESLEDVAQVEGAVRREGRMMNMMLSPRPGARKPKEPKDKGKKSDKVTGKEKVASHGQEQIQEQQPLRPRQDAEDSGEAG